jgi:hypothetical protein
MAAVFFSVASPATVLADPTGTTFSFQAINFQGNGADPAVPFGVPTSIPGAGVTVDSMATTSPMIPGLTVGGLDFIEFAMTTDNGEYLASDPLANSTWVISGLNWGSDPRPAVAAGLIFLAFDIDGNFVDLTTALGVPIVPHPITGADSIPIDIQGEDVSLIPFDTGALVGMPLQNILAAFGVPLLDVRSVNSMHVGFEVMLIPEPGSLALVSCGLTTLALTCIRRRTRQHRRC